MTGVPELLDELRREVNTALDRLLPTVDTWPTRLHEAMRYAVMGGGKRVRPILTLIAYRAAGGAPDAAMEAACALELIHTYSLIHDDLPALDDDTLRRGRPTVHVAFDEALAILAGDALLTEGLTLLGRFPEGERFARHRSEAVRLVGEAIGSRGMVGGQVEDLEATGAHPSAERLERIHRAKTGALITAAVELGALLADTREDMRRAFHDLGRGLGLLFQITDDILDVTGTAAELGKSPGKDVAAGKLTYPAVHGLDAARRHRDGLAADLKGQAGQCEGEGGILALLIDYVARRDR